MKLYAVRVFARDRDRLCDFYRDTLALPERQPWGGTLAYFRNPEGNVLTLLG